MEVGKQIDVSSQEKHLGLVREPIDTASATVAANIKNARRCAYSLMGAGMKLGGLHKRATNQVRLASGLNLSPPKKSEWKLIVKKHVNEYWIRYLQEEASQKTTLRHLCTDICTIGKLHPVWRKTPYNKMTVLHASVRVKIIVGWYTLQEDLSKYRGSDVACPLCKAAPENLYHLILLCMY